MNAWLTRAGRYLLCLCGALAPGLAAAVDCPVAPEDPYSVISGWDDARSPGTYSITHVTAGPSSICGYVVNVALGGISGSGLSLGAAISGMDSVLSSGGFTLAATCSTSSGSTSWIWRIFINGSGTQRKGGRAQTTTTAAACDQPPQDPTACEIYENVQAQGFADGKPENWVPPETSCIEMASGAHCASFRRGKLNDGTTSCIPGTDAGCEPVPYSRNGDSFMWRDQMTGLTCDPPTPEPEEIVVEGEACNGPYCEGMESRPGCGFLNDKYICTPLGEDECIVYPDGSRSCAGGAPTPPVPDNGTPGVPATPDESIEVCTGEDSCQTINNYDTTTVGGSSRPPGGGTAPTNGPGSGVIGNGAGPTDGGDGDGDGEGEGEESSVSGGGTCDAAPVCEGDAIQCAILNQEWRARCPDEIEQADLEAQFGPAGNEDGEFLGPDHEYTAPSAFNSTGVLGGAACLDDIVLDLGELGDYEVPISMWCDWMALIGVLVMVTAYVGGIKIVMGGI